MLVLCPDDPAQFNGTVIVEWNSVSAGESFFLGRSAPQLLKDGFAVVGVSAQFLGVEGTLDMSVPSLKSQNPQRYASMNHPSDDYSYDIFAQAGELLGSHQPRDPDPLNGLDVRHLITVGISQSSARLAGYVNGIHAVSSIYDAFFLVVYPNSPCALNGASAPAELPQTYGPNGFHLLEWHKHLLRDDLELPIIVLNSESEASECYPNSQPDTALLRWWEIAGTSHTSVATAEELEAMGFVIGTSGIVLVGGGARSPAYRRAVADLSGLAVLLPAQDEQVALGACVQAAAVLSGRSISQIQEMWGLGSGTTISPDIEFDGGAVRGRYHTATHNENDDLER